MAQNDRTALRTSRDQQLGRCHPAVDNLAARDVGVIASVQELGRAGTGQAVLDQTERTNVVGHVEIGLGITERQRLLALDTQVPAETCDGNALVEAGGIDVKRAAILDAFELERRRLGQMRQVAVAGPDQTAVGLVQDGLTSSSGTSPRMPTVTSRYL